MAHTAISGPGSDWDSHGWFLRNVPRWLYGVYGLRRMPPGNAATSVRIARGAPSCERVFPRAEEG
jgi:hypothetical protein